MTEQPINVRTLVHHIEHLVLYSAILWQFILGFLILVKTYFKYWKPPQPVIFGGGEYKSDTNISDISNKNKKNLNVIDVDFKKDIFIEKADSFNVKTDKVIKGKVKTQKDKLKKLRGK